VTPLVLAAPSIEAPADLGVVDPEGAAEPLDTIPVAVVPPTPVAEVDALVVIVTGVVKCVMYLISKNAS
jgi:hypothetical protein